MLTSLRSKILLALTGTVLFSILIIMFFVKIETDKEIAVLQNANAQHLVSTVLLNVENQYKNLVFHREALLEQKKKELQHVIELALIPIKKNFSLYKQGRINEMEAKRRAIEAVKLMRYAGGVGYIWINDMGRPIPKMIMHPTIPVLDGKVLGNPAFNCALGKRKNLFVAAVDVARANGAGYVDYLWPKPTTKGLTAEQEKISYVKAFKEWKWVVGTGVYVDDIELAIKKRLDTMLADLEHTFSSVRIGENGYMYLFTGDKDMLIHPSLAGADFSKLINPTTGNPILDDLVVASKAPSKILEYVWDKPPDHKSDFRFWKKSHIAYFQPLDWYIASSVYTDEIEAPANQITQYVLLLSLLILLFAFILSVWLAKHLSQPLQLLTSAAQEIEYENLTGAAVPVTGSIETKRLGEILNKTLESIRETVETKEELFKTKLALELRLHKAEKLESVGRLAPGIAHEINTPMQGVRSNIDFIEDAVQDLNQLLKDLFSLLAKAQKESTVSDDVAKKIDEVFINSDWEFLADEVPVAITQSKESLLRIATIVGAMKTFSHPGSGELEYSDVNQGIKSTVIVTSNEWKYAADMDLQLDETLPNIPILVDEVNQVILNMITNSVQAITEKNKDADSTKGLIRITTSKSGEYIQIDVSDTGNGMSEDVIKKVFEPFFTTKGIGKGTGQGLAIAQDVIVDKHKGTIKIDSVPGEGTTFSIKLPIQMPS